MLNEILALILYPIPNWFSFRLVKVIYVPGSITHFMKYWLILLILLLFSCKREEQIIPVDIQVFFHVKDSNYTAPLYLHIENQTKNAQQYVWVFDGGIPDKSSAQHPSLIRFDTPGEHIIRLTATNEAHSQTCEFSIHVDSSVVVDFRPEAIINNYAPALYRFENKSSGGNSYRWTFEGGEPADFVGQHPPLITFSKEGVYTISLQTDNGSARFFHEKQIRVEPSLAADFEIIPSFEDEDYEAPLRARCHARLQGVESFEWRANGAELTNATQTEADVFYQEPGLYVISLIVSNGKETNEISRQIEVKSNRNLRVHKDVRLGINTAQESIGSCYSTKLRRVVRRSEMNTIDAQWIDIVYEGLNKEMNLNRFISPDQTPGSTIFPIPGASKTYLINKQEEGTILLTPQQFLDMNDDHLLRTFDLSTIDYGKKPFEKAALPRVVLFQTADERRGAILVKDLVCVDETNSYLLVDIKIQKND